MNIIYNISTYLKFKINKNNTNETKNMNNTNDENNKILNVSFQEDIESQNNESQNNESQNNESQNNESQNNESQNNEEPSENYIDNPEYLYYYVKDLNLKDIMINYYENKRVSEIFFIEGNQKHGLYESYYKNGRLKKRCSYNNNEIHGKVEEFYNNGQLKAQFYMNNGYFGSCLYSEYYENCQLKTKHLLLETGKIIGDYIIYYEDGKIQEHKNTKEENKIIYNKDGTKRLIIDYKNETGIIYYQNNKIETKYKFKKEYGENILNGFCEKYYESGNISEIGTYSSNLKNGKFESYYDNFDNSKKEFCNYRYDIKEGNVIEYEEDGRVKNEYNIQNRKWYYLYLW